MPIYHYVYAYWVSLYDETRARNLNINDQKAVNSIHDELADNIIMNSAIREDQITRRYNSGRVGVPNDDDLGLIIPVGHGLNKKLQSMLNEKEHERLRKAIQDVLVGEVPDKESLRWYRMQRAYIAINLGCA
ncbi:hypothetical protein RhiJN_08709 [Ceratobasidium sp. AG-Ba]|nr:hypothetical protein RhiJN_01418 [Ceratobasidium sp. AG-Ba]QRV80694.1 hypothetical protein RhiJN_08709 [Ceratobasidium sp. AG-Ba]QRW02408.1 hypothetical protein RhiLY_01406 [Ceratobasidium sp. AG-Ba]